MFVPYRDLPGLPDISGGYVRYNLNPAGHRTTDCTVRAIALATGMDWDETYIGLCAHGFVMKSMPDNDDVWWSYLHTQGFTSHYILSYCPSCMTVDEFCRENPAGLYVIATPGHVLCAIARRDRPAAPATEQQLQNRRRFALLSRAVKEWFAANRPGRESPSSPGTIEYYNLHNLYLQQNKVGSFPAFVFRHVAAQYDETCQPTE